jgi:hypothetical protein
LRSAGQLKNVCPHYSRFKNQSTKYFVLFTYFRLLEPLLSSVPVADILFVAPADAKPLLAAVF